MGLDITLGGLTRTKGKDDEWVKLVQSQLDIANELLGQQGYPPYREAEDPLVMDNRCPNNHFSYSTIHFLRRAYAHRVLHPDRPVEPLPEEMDEANDDALRAIRQRGVSHIACHSDAGGMYLPADFRPILSDRRLEGEIGSSYRLMEELKFVAPAIGIRLEEELPDNEIEKLRSLWKPIPVDQPIHLFGRELSMWLYLFEAARLSIKHGILIWFC